MSTTNTYIPRGPAETELTFYVPPADGSTPFNYVESPPEGYPQRNYLEGPQSITLTDIRGQENAFNLDDHAFQVLQNIPTQTTYSSFDTDDAVKTKYYPEVESLLFNTLPSVHKVILFDHTIRRQTPNSPRQPVNRAHVDQTPKAAAERVRLHVSDPEEAERLLRGRYRIINVWKPLNGTVQSAPLAFASGASVSPEDLVPVEHRYPHRTGETMGVRYNPKQEWMYLSGMQDEERLLLKCCDTADGVRERVPHTAFWDRRTPEDAKPRESIEVRALVFG